jgi:hypothetical protein
LYRCDWNINAEFVGLLLSLVTAGAGVLPILM